MNKKLISYVVTGAMVLGLASGVTLYGGIAKAASNATPVKKAVNVNNQQPVYSSTIKVANPQDNANDRAKNAKDNEKQESTQLASMAKITAEQAKASALKAVAGTVTKVELDNENGNLVYSVEVKTSNSIIDVKVDAGNGKILAQDSGQDKENKASEKESKASETEKSSTADNDNVQLEQQGEYNN